MTTANDAFDFACGTRIIHGLDVVERAGDLARELGATSVLLVTDPGLVRAGHAERLRGILDRADLRVTTFDEVHANPTTDDVEACADVARGAAPDLIVALGGGSSIDAAKGCNFILTNGGRMRDYHGRGRTTRDMLPLIAVPTTAGTGSEVQSYAIIADAASHEKMACGDPRALPRIALLDPALAVSQPRTVIACSGLDAVAHAVETAVTTKRNAMSQLLSREAFRLASAALPRVLADAADLDAQGDMLLAAAVAGLAIENSMLGAAHSMANPLTAAFDLTHGHAVAIMLPHVVRFNASDDAARRSYEALHAQCENGAENGAATGLDRLIGCLHDLYGASGLPRTLPECGVPESAIPMLASAAAAQWTARFNPVRVTESDFARLYAAAF